MKIFKVGGCVRDTILGRTPKDTDYVVVDSTPPEMMAAGFSNVGKDFPVFLHPGTKDEYALARKERSIGASYTAFECSTTNVSLEQDLGRRDLTMNAMAMSEDGTIIDPYNGQESIEKKQFKHVSDAFREDPVRVLRLARFRAELCGNGSTDLWTIAHETKVMCHSMRGSLGFLTKERIWKEVEKVLAIQNDDESPLAVFLETLYELRVLDVIFPEIYEMVHCREGSKHHREANVFVHTMMMLRTGSYSPRVQLAILFHDIAKPFTYRTHGSSAGHDDQELVQELLPHWIPTKLRSKILFLVQNHTRIYKTASMKPSKIAKLLVSYKDDTLLKDQLQVASADDKGRNCDPGIAKEIEYDPIIEAYIQIKAYSPEDWIYETTMSHEKSPSGESIKQHIHKHNIYIVKKCFKK